MTTWLAPINTSNDDGSVTTTLDDLLLRVRDDDTAKERLLQILDALGPSDPVALTYRRRLANLLY